MAKKSMMSKLDMPKKARPMDMEMEDEMMDLGDEGMEDEDMEEMDLDMMAPEEEMEPVMLSEASVEELEAELEKRKMEEEMPEDEDMEMEEEPEDEDMEY